MTRKKAVLKKREKNRKQKKRPIGCTRTQRKYSKRKKMLK